jgi:hypothetical protein
MSSNRDFERAVDRWLDDGSDATPPHLIDAVLLAARSTPQERQFRVPWRTASMTPYLRVAAVIALVVLGSTAAFTLGPKGFGGTNATPSPSPVLIARGNFVEHDFGPVEFEATRVGSSVMGRMTIAGRDGQEPRTVDLQCVRETEDGVVLIGGYFRQAGTAAWVAIKRGFADRATVATPLPDQPATEATDCLANMDRWLQRARIQQGGPRVPFEPYLVRDGRIEFGPPIPVLIARGDFATNVGEVVEFEATREGSDVTGRMIVSAQGQNEPYTFTVDLQCARTDEDGLVMIGGITTKRTGEEAPQEGNWAGIYLERKSPVEVSIWRTPVRARGGECLEFLDDQLAWERTTHLEPVDFAGPVEEGAIELGP